MKKIILSICFIAYLIPTFGQVDTLAKYGINSKYDFARYKTPFGAKIDKSDFIIGELDRVTNSIGITYKGPPQYFISEAFSLKYPPENPEELCRSTGGTFASKWIHEDGECILFIECNARRNLEIDKSFDELLESGEFDWINYRLGIGKYFNVSPTKKEMRKIRRKITIWSPKKSKETFNAHYVITYPVKDKKAVYMGKYAHKFELIMIKWGEPLSVSFLVTDKGYKNIKEYIKDVEEAFRFED